MSKYGGGIAYGRDWTTGKFTKGSKGRPKGAKNRRTIQRVNDHADFESGPHAFMERMREKNPAAYVAAVVGALPTLDRLRFDDAVYVVGEGNDWPAELSAALGKMLAFSYTHAERLLKVMTGKPADDGDAIRIMTAIERARSEMRDAEAKALAPPVPPPKSPTSFEARYGFSERELSPTIEKTDYDLLG